jgi:hypothetical protein
MNVCYKKKQKLFVLLVSIFDFNFNVKVWGRLFLVIDGPGRIFQYRQPRPQKLVLSRFIQRTTRIFPTLQYKRARGSGDAEKRLANEMCAMAL